MRIVRPPHTIEDQTLVPIGFVQNESIGAEAKLVYMLMLSHDQAGEPDPDVATLCAETGLAPHHVEAAISTLESITDDEWKRMGL